MKAVTQGITRCNDPLNVKNEVFKIHRPKMDEGEMSACFSKLKELVPSIPHNKKISKTQLLQHVIDYIYDLELSLDYQPVQSLFSSTVREPLSEKTEPNQMVIDENEADCELDYERPASK